MTVQQQQAHKQREEERQRQQQRQQEELKKQGSKKLLLDSSTTLPTGDGTSLGMSSFLPSFSGNLSLSSAGRFGLSSTSPLGGSGRLLNVNKTSAQDQASNGLNMSQRLRGTGAPNGSAANANGQFDLTEALGMSQRAANGLMLGNSGRLSSSGRMRAGTAQTK